MNDPARLVIPPFAHYAVPVNSQDQKYIQFKYVPCIKNTFSVPTFVIILW